MASALQISLRLRPYFTVFLLIRIQYKHRGYQESNTMVNLVNKSWAFISLWHPYNNNKKFFKQSLKVCGISLIFISFSCYGLRSDRELCDMGFWFKSNRELINLNRKHRNKYLLIIILDYLSYLCMNYN